MAQVKERGEVGSRFISRAVKTENPFPRSIFAPKPNGKRLLLRLAWSLDGVFPVPLGQFTSVTYLRRTGGKHLDKNRMRACVAF